MTERRLYLVRPSVALFSRRKAVVVDLDDVSAVDAPEGGDTIAFSTVAGRGRSIKFRGVPWAAQVGAMIGAFLAHSEGDW